MLHPRYRGDCADFFSTPQQTGSVEFLAPIDVTSELEHAAARAGRTWNDQLCYIVKLLLGDQLPDFDDGRSVEDWRTLLSPCSLRVSETEDWIPFTSLGEDGE